MAEALRAELAELAEARGLVETRLRAQPPRGPALPSRRVPFAQRPRVQAPPAEAAFGAQRPLLLSSVVVPANEAHGAAAEESATVAVDASPAPQEAHVAQPDTRKRPSRAEDDNPALRKRNQRMLGALMGTLQKFRQEEGGNSRQEATAKRTSMLQRAEEREREESKRLRDLQRTEASESRRSDLLLRQQLAASMEEKRLHLAHLTWLEHQSRLTPFLVTAAAPPLCFLPAKLCEATRSALSARQASATQDVAAAEARLAEALRQSKADAAQREAELRERWDAGRGDADEATTKQTEGGVARPVQARADDEPVADEEIEEAATVNPAGLEGVLGDA